MLPLWLWFACQQAPITPLSPEFSSCIADEDGVTCADIQQHIRALARSEHPSDRIRAYRLAAKHPHIVDPAVIDAARHDLEQDDARLVRAAALLVEPASVKALRLR